MHGTAIQRLPDLASGDAVLLDFPPRGSSMYCLGPALVACSRLFGFGRFQQSDSLHLIQKIAAVYDVVELERILAAAQVSEKLFQCVVWVVGLDGDRPQISGVAKPDKEL